MSGPVRVRPHRRGKNYYIRGVKDDYAVSGIIRADSREQARQKFREHHPKYKIVHVNERT